jgi:lycopene cyclase domain-containing protein
MIFLALELAMNSLYLWINILTIAFPLLLSFDKKVKFYQYWPQLFPAITITAILFLIWDQWFTNMAVWGFNQLYILGYYCFDIPIEEVLFFFTVPYACVFVYECLKAYLRKSETFDEFYRWLTLLFFGISVTLLYWYNDRLYTAITCLVLTAILGTHLVVIKRRYMSWFYFAYVVSLIPMLIVNGILTYLPVVDYNPEEIIGIRIGSIPVEDFIYNMTMLVICIGLYEWFKRLAHRRRLHRQTQSS